MTETRSLSRFASIANAAFNSMTANSTAVTSMTIGGVAMNANGVASNTFTIGTAAYFVANGNLGIGTASPGTRLDIYDAASAGTPAVRIRDNVSDLRLYPSGGGSYVATISNTPLIFNTNNTERMRIAADGKVGIGTTPVSSTPTILFTAGDHTLIGGARGFLFNMYYSSTNTRWEYAANAPAAGWVDAGTGTTVFLSTGNVSGAAGSAAALNERMRIDSNGLVGIGTTSPAVRLNVNSGATDEIARFDASSASNPYISLYRQGTRMSFWYAPGGSYTELGSEGRPLYLTTSSGTHPIHFFTNSVERARITADGHFVPQATNTYDLGSSSLRWRNIFTNDLNLSNGIGDYTIVEGEDDLFLYNNKKGKVYKFALIEVDPNEAPEKMNV